MEVKDRLLKKPTDNGTYNENVKLVYKNIIAKTYYLMQVETEDLIEAGIFHEIFGFVYYRNEFYKKYNELLAVIPENILKKHKEMEFELVELEYFKHWLKEYDSEDNFEKWLKKMYLDEVFGFESKNF